MSHGEILGVPEGREKEVKSYKIYKASHLGISEENNASGRENCFRLLGNFVTHQKAI